MYIISAEGYGVVHRHYAIIGFDRQQPKAKPTTFDRTFCYANIDCVRAEMPANGDSIEAVEAIWCIEDIGDVATTIDTHSILSIFGARKDGMVANYHCGSVIVVSW